MLTKKFQKKDLDSAPLDHIREELLIFLPQYQSFRLLRLEATGRPSAKN